MKAELRHQDSAKVKGTEEAITWEVERQESVASKRHPRCA